ncbi:MAG TPA: PEP-CTERM sorting domain-containing protein [Sedimentisphaerales bacterium]|nr:PEP-CTERM sorting domain-containing protein [Sedimentisphaerales bacterium]
MKKIIVLTAIIMLVASFAGATPIESINANYLLGIFTPTGGTYGLGALNVNDTAQIVVEDIYNVQTTHPANAFMLNVSLYQDNSVGAIADGLFANGTLVINSLLSADILPLQLTELYNNSGILAGIGTLQVTGGSLAADFGSLGDIVQITFSVTPSSINDFSQRFSGISNITLTPTPEPVTIMLLGLGGLVALRKRN